MIEIQLFRFDYKTDYLPYYKKYNFKLKKLSTIANLLNTIYDIEKFSYLKDELFFVRANGLFVDTQVDVADVLQGSTDLVIEPISIKRALNDLIIDTKDYQKKLSLLDPYVSEDEKQTIINSKKYMLEYYASNTLNYCEEYIGEHVLFLASELIQDKAELKDELTKLVDTKDGIRIRTSLANRILNSNEQSSKSYDTVEFKGSIAQSFENFNIALYCGTNDNAFEEIIEKSKAQYVDISSKYFDIPKGTHLVSYLMAGTVLLEAFDSDADFLIVNDSEELKLFDAQQKKIEKTMGREIALPVVTREEFIELLQGSKTLASRKIKIPFLAA
jgi:succinate dehydrogenase/fumarate reductase-like Fe-S protein